MERPEDTCHAADDTSSSRTGRDMLEEKRKHLDRLNKTSTTKDTEALDITEWPDRESYGRQYWGKVHLAPPCNIPERLNLFVKPNPMSAEQKAKILANHRKTLVGDLDEEQCDASFLADHLRPKTPPAERAEKRIQRLVDGGMSVSPGARGKIVRQCYENNGLVSSLRQYCQGETHVEVKYVNELILEIDRLKLEMATQLAAQQRRYVAELDEKDAKIDSLKKNQTMVPQTIDNEDEHQGTESVVQRPENKPEMFETPARLIVASSDKSTRTDMNGLQIDLQRSKQERNQLAAGVQTLTGQLEMICEKYESRVEESKRLELAAEEVLRIRSAEQLSYNNLKDDLQRYKKEIRHLKGQVKVFYHHLDLAMKEYGRLAIGAACRTQSSLGK